jgi:hypothetical protein
VKPSRPSVWSAAIVVLAIATLAGARSATVKDKAHLRAGPGGTTDLLGDVAAGATVEILSDNGGWRQVRTPDGLTGFVWSDHLVEGDGEPKPTDAARKDGAAQQFVQPPAARSVLDEIRSLRDDVGVLRDRPAAATGADLDRLRAEVERLASAQQVLSRRLDERLLPAADRPPPEAPLAGLGPLIFILGAGFGWIVSRMLQGRRDHRQRNRIRI